MRGFALLAATWMFVLGCSSGADGGEWIASVQKASASADELVASGRPEDARHALEAALALPSHGMDREDVRVVRQDLFYRVGRLDLAAGRADAARARADQGLTLGRGSDVFTANLLILRGRALETAGNAAAASRDYHEALVINEALLDKALGEEEEETP
jgi:tetratricopeptide (TPR) repeat protein